MGIATFQYLRMMGGVDTAMPDKIVRRGVKAILDEAQAETGGCRSADICWCLQ